MAHASDLDGDRSMSCGIHPSIAEMIKKRDDARPGSIDRA
jgi:hypothetical protein